MPHSTSRWTAGSTESPPNRLTTLGWGQTSHRWPLIVSLGLGLGLVGSLIYIARGLGSWSPTTLPVSSVFRLSCLYLLFPALTEELLWRWCLIPLAAFESLARGLRAVLLNTIISTLAHPLVALTLAPQARSLFFDPDFLGITSLLQATCGAAYVLSRSIWPGVFLHWLTIVVWKFLFGGPFLFFAP